MKTLNNLIYEAGGYSAKDLENASNTERRQILQLGSAVLFSIIASIISWGAASTLLVSPDQDLTLSTLIVFVTICVVFPLSMSLNRNLIFYSDMKVEEEFTYSYSEANKGSINTLLYLRIMLVVIVAILNLQVFEGRFGYLLLGVLALLELYPLLLKKQIGQTILGRRMKAKLSFQHERGKLKEEEYARQLRESGQALSCEGCPVATNDSTGADFDNVSSINNR